MEERPQKELTDHDHVFLSWRAPARVFKKRERKYFLKLGFVTFFFLIAFFLFKDFWLMALTLVFVFTIFVLNIFPPGKVENKILNKGLLLNGRIYPWCEMVGFWFSQEEGNKAVHFKTKRGFLEEFSAPLGQVKKEEAKKALCLFLPFLENPQRSFLGKVEKYFLGRFL